MIPEGAEEAKAAGIPVQSRRADWFRKEYPDWTERFKPVEEKENQKVYVLEENFPFVSGEECFAVKACELVECYCNGEFVDFSLWGQHRFEIGTFLKPGENEIRLVVTGNAANKYENAGIAFGLGE